jgi:hypothetical protein
LVSFDHAIAASLASDWGGGRLEARPILKKDDATILLWAAGKGTAKIV